MRGRGKKKERSDALLYRGERGGEKEKRASPFYPVSPAPLPEGIKDSSELIFLLWRRKRKKGEK